MAIASHAPTPRPLSRAEYHRMGELDFFRGERVELVRGVVVRMAPIGPRHASVVQRLGELLIPKLLGRATVRIQQPLVAADDSEPEPDVAVVPWGRYADGHPDRAILVIEVAESSLDYDRTTKAWVYAASAVDEYWVVDVVRRVVEVHTNPCGEGYALVRSAGAGEILRPSAFDDAAVAVDDILPREPPPNSR